MKLLPYQERGVEFILNAWRGPRKAALLADEMGLGKTVQAIFAANQRVNLQSYLPWVVCPKSLIINWKNELEKCGAREADRWRVISYEQLAKVDKKTNHVGILIADEAHYLKNSSTQRFHHFRHWWEECEYGLLLTGTPIANYPGELWALLSLLNEPKWGESRTRAGMRKKFAFERDYCGGFFMHLRKDIPCIKGNHEGLRCRGCRWVANGATQKDTLALELTHEPILRRLKSDVLTELPPKRRILTLTDDHNRAWPRRHTVEPFTVGTNETYEIALKRLRADKPAFEAFSKARYHEGLTKAPKVAERAIQILENRSEKLVIMAYHRNVMHAIASKLTEMGLQPGQWIDVDGSMTPERRQDAVDVFQDDPNVKVFIGTVRSCAVGFTLTAASHMLLGEFDLNPAVQVQVEDRLHRIGQRDSVIIEHVAFQDGIDIHILKMLLKKQENISEILSAVENKS